MSVETKKRVAVLPFPGIENAFVCVSGREKAPPRRHGEKWHESHIEETCKDQWPNEFRTEPHMTFAYVHDNCCAEWDGEHGPVQLWFRCEKDYEKDWDKAREHWIFDYAYGSGHWSQLAVDRDGLPQAFNRGDYAHIFAVLKRWAVSNAEAAKEAS